MTALDTADLENRFGYHQPTSEEVKRRHEAVRYACIRAARELVNVTRPGREQSSAVAALELAMFWPTPTSPATKGRRRHDHQRH